MMFSARGSIDHAIFTAVFSEIEGEDTFVIRGALKYFRMAQSANGVVIAGTPVFPHAGAREFVIF
jgi:hypothetical protein